MVNLPMHPGSSWPSSPRCSNGGSPKGMTFSSDVAFSDKKTSISHDSSWFSLNCPSIGVCLSVKCPERCSSWRRLRCLTDSVRTMSTTWRSAARTSPRCGAQISRPRLGWMHWKTQENWACLFVSEKRGHYVMNKVINCCGTPISARFGYLAG